MGRRVGLHHSALLLAILIASCILSMRCTLAPMEERPKPYPPPESTYEVPPLPQGGSSFDVEPELVTMQEPQYPDIARESHQQGTVFCDVLVDEHGLVREVRVAKGVSSSLDQAAVTAARTAVYKPAKQKGVPVAIWTRIPVEFRLK